MLYEDCVEGSDPLRLLERRMNMKNGNGDRTKLLITSFKSKDNKSRGFEVGSPGNYMARADALEIRWLVVNFSANNTYVCQVLLLRECLVSIIVNCVNLICSIVGLSLFH